MGTAAAVPTRFRLKEILDARGISQRQLAADSGVSPTTINRMCGNLTAQVSLATLDAIAEALGDVEPGDLLEREKRKRR